MAKNRDYVSAGVCMTSNDGGKTWEQYRRKTARNKRVEIKRDEYGVYFVKVTR